jgi:hypothetical protein
MTRVYCVVIGQKHEALQRYTPYSYIYSHAPDEDTAWRIVQHHIDRKHRVGPSVEDVRLHSPRICHWKPGLKIITAWNVSAAYRGLMKAKKQGTVKKQERLLQKLTMRARLLAYKLVRLHVDLADEANEFCPPWAPDAAGGRFWGRART